MKRPIAAVALLLFMTSATGGDIWNNLFQEKLQEAKQGNPEAQYDIGTMYQNGRGVKADRAKAIEWYNRAASQGEAKSTSRLKLMEANTARFEKTTSLASKDDLDALYDLGNMYLKGVGTSIDPARAIAAFEQSADLGNIKAAYKLGLVYLEGTGVRQNNNRAFKWFSLAANSGFPAAQYYLGKLYAEGLGVKQDRNQALVWLGKAVDGGFDQARREMIDVSESMSETASEDPGQQTGTRKVPGKKKSVAKKARKVVKKKPAKRYSAEDVMLAVWHRDGKPVAWLPSAINTCRTEDDRVICFSDDQTRNTGGNAIKFKTKAIISNFTSAGSFDVTYRNLVINSKQISTGSPDQTVSEPGNAEENQSANYAVKTGWSNPHTLKCTIKNKSTINCLKNRTHSIVLTSPTSLAAGK